MDVYYTKDTICIYTLLCLVVLKSFSGINVTTVGFFDEHAVFLTGAHLWIRYIVSVWIEFRLIRYGKIWLGHGLSLTSVNLIFDQDPDIIHMVVYLEMRVLQYCTSSLLRLLLLF